jgi:hypothetical protein
MGNRQEFFEILKKFLIRPRGNLPSVILSSSVRKSA